MGTRFSRRALLGGAAAVVAARSGLLAKVPAWWPLDAAQAAARGTPECASPPAGGPVPEPARRVGPILPGGRYRQAKDPCPVFDGRLWHLFGSGWTNDHDGCVVLHATAPDIEGPYVEHDPAELVGVSGSGLSAPGVAIEGGVFHLFIQTEFAKLGGTIEHLVSIDGHHFERTGTALPSDARVGEACIYDAEPAIIGGRRYLAYAATMTAGQPDLHLAVSTSNSWDGPWERLGPILRQDDVPFHNRLGCGHYEWGLEGPQLAQLPDGTVLLTAVCFLPSRGKGTRQRVFFAVAPSARGPYRVLGTPISPLRGDWDGGENGHGATVVRGSELVLLYQGRVGKGKRWQVGAAVFDARRFR